MRVLLINIISLIKGFFFLLKPNSYLGFLITPSILLGNSLKLSKWISAERKKGIEFDDFFRFIRRYEDRFKLHDYIIKSELLKTEKIYFLEFGVASGTSFKWWLHANNNSESKFFGFDTFEGLPQDWGIFKKGEMAPIQSNIKDNRYVFIKGLFNSSLPKFLESTNLDPNIRKIIHLDADLFGSTLFVLVSLHKTLKSGDILFFDEFCVPNHEFLAFDIFTKLYDVKYHTVGAVNNYLQIAIKIE